MISGVLQFNEARIRLKVSGPLGSENGVVGVVDTGYSGELTLPSATVAKLGLQWRSRERATLADGSECQFDVYKAKVVWDGVEKEILVDEANAVSLVGMKLMNGFELKIQVRPRGNVTLKRLHSKYQAGHHA